MMDEQKETRVLEYLEGGLSADEERTLLADAARDPELAAILKDYREQERLLHGFHDAQAAAADRLRRPDLSSLPAAQAVVRRGPSTAVRWMAAAAVVAVLAGSATVFMRADGAPLGTVAHASGVARAFDDGRTISLAGDSVIAAGFERIKTTPESSIEIDLARGGTLELNENSTVHLGKAGNAAELELDRGEILLHGASATVRTPWFAAESKGASFSVARGLRGAEVAVARGSVEVRQDGTRRNVGAGESWSSTGARTMPVARRVAWSRHAEELAPASAPEPVKAAHSPAGPSVEVATAAPAEASAVAASAAASTAVVAASSTTDYLPAGTLGFVEIPSLPDLLGIHDLSDAVLGDRLRGIVHDGIDNLKASAEERERMHRDVNEFFDNADLNLVLSSLGGALSVGATKDGPILIAEVTANLAEVETLVDETLPARMADAATDGHLHLAVADGLLVIAFDRAGFDATTSAVRAGTPTGFGSSAFVREVRGAVGSGGKFVAASDIQAIVQGQSGSESDSIFFRRMGWENLHSIIASPSFADDADNRGLQMRFDGPREGVMAWLDKPGPMSGFEFFSPDAHVLTAARIQSPLEMLHQIVAWRMEDGGLEIEKLETDDGYLLMNEFAASLGNEVVLGVDNPVLPVPNVKFVVELTDPAGFHDGMLALVEHLSAQGGDAGQIVSEASAYRNHLIVDLKVPGKVVGVSYAVVDDYAVFGPGRPFLQAAIDTFVDRRSIARESAFVEALPAKSGSNVSWLLFAAHNESLRDATPILSQILAQRGVPFDLDAVSTAVPGRSVVMYAIADDDRIDYYLEGIKGEFQMTGMLPAVTQWLVGNGS